MNYLCENRIFLSSQDFYKMIKRDLYISSTDTEQQLHYIVWQPDAQPVAVLQIVHGMEEYVERYEPFAQYIVSLGWAVIGHDHLGHGKSGKHIRGHFSDSPLGPHLIIDDIHLITMQAKELWDDVPVCIMGHSMGSFLTRRYLCEHSHDVQSAIIMGSGWYPPIATGLCYYAARLTCALRGRHAKSKPLSALCSAPFLFAYRGEGRNAWLSVNKANAESFTTDPLRGFGFTAGGYEYMYRNLFEVSCHTLFSQMRRDLPILFISGEHDKVGGASAVAKMSRDYRKRGFMHVSEYVVKGVRHELFFEDNAKYTMDYIGKWLLASGV